MGPLHQLLHQGVKVNIAGHHHEFTVDGQPSKRWKGNFDFRQGNTLGPGGFLEDYAGTVVVDSDEAEVIPLREGLRLTVYDRHNKPFRQLQVRDISPQPAAWICTLQSPNQ